MNLVHTKSEKYNHEKVDILRKKFIELLAFFFYFALYINFNKKQARIDVRNIFCICQRFLSSKDINLSFILFAQ